MGWRCTSYRALLYKEKGSRLSSEWSQLGSLESLPVRDTSDSAVDSSRCESEELHLSMLRIELV